MKKRVNCVIFLIILILFTLTFSAMAVPKLINYQGRLTDVNGISLNGVYIARFYLFCEEIDGNSVWSEQQELTIADGIYNVQLGAENTLAPHLFNNEDLYLEVEIFNQGKGWEILSPRQHITSTAFAINADMLDGKHASEFIVPKGAIILWRGSSCPDGFSRVTELDGKFLVSGSNYNPAAGGSNTHAHGAGTYQGPSHTHTGQTSGGSDIGWRNCMCGSDPITNTAHTHIFTTDPSGTGSITGTSAPADSRPEFAAILLCEKD